MVEFQNDGESDTLEVVQIKHPVISILGYEYSFK